MKNLSRLAALAAMAWCASAATHIHDTLLLNDGVTPMTGKIAVSGPSGATVGPTNQTITIGANGVVDFSLVGCAGCAYRAIYSLTNSTGVVTQSYEERWIVPNTSSTLTVQQLWGGSLAPYYLTSLQQLNPAGFSDGMVVGFTGGMFAPVAPGGSGSNAVQIQSRGVSSTLPTNGQALVWNNATSQWEPQNQSGTSSGTTWGDWGGTWGGQ